MAVYAQRLVLPAMRAQMDVEEVREVLYNEPWCEDVECDLEKHCAIVFYVDPKAIDDIYRVLDSAGFPAHRA